MAERCLCGHFTEEHQRKRFITGYKRPCDRCRCGDFAVNDSSPEDVERDELQCAYNAVCSAIGRLDSAGWQHSTVKVELEAVRASLAQVLVDIDDIKKAEG